jgi:hypothetical protein
MDQDMAMKRLALWALISRTSDGGRRAWRAMDHGIALENATGLSVFLPEMDAAHRWAEQTYGEKARARSWWGLA